MRKKTFRSAVIGIKKKIKGGTGNKETNLKTNVNKNNRIIEGT
jgi:hypothetical protein